jgi:SAM-dependent methyltransferase
VGDDGPDKTFDHLVRRSDEFLFGLDVRGREILEVGAGRGFLAHYLATCKEARHVTALDEYEGHGSSESSIETISNMREYLANAHQLSIVKGDFLEFESTQRFDFVFFVNVIHHIVVTRESLIDSPMHLEAAVDLCRRSARLLKPGGGIVIQEMGPTNLCPLPKYRKNMKNIDWASKQHAGAWCTALRTAAFTKIRVRYRYPINVPLIRLLRPLFNHHVASLLTDSSYIIEAGSPNKVR